MNQNTQVNSKNIRFFLYARKSTESDDRQVLSIDSQIAETQQIKQQQQQTAAIQAIANQQQQMAAMAYTQPMTGVRPGMISYVSDSGWLLPVVLGGGALALLLVLRK
jgi:YesN/AraC family two-component response regulator